MSSCHLVLPILVYLILGDTVKSNDCGLHTIDEVYAFSNQIKWKYDYNTKILGVDWSGVDYDSAADSSVKLTWTTFSSSNKQFSSLRSVNGSAISISSESINELKLTIGQCQLLPVILSTSSSALREARSDQNCGKGFYDVLLRVNNEKEWGYMKPIWFSEETLNPTGKLYEDSIKTPHYYMNVYNEYCFGMQREGDSIVWAEWLKFKLTDQQQTLKSAFENDAGSDVGFNDIASLTDEDFKMEKQNSPQDKGFIFHAEDIAERGMFGAIAKRSGNHFNIFGVGVSFPENNDSSDSPVVGFSKIQKSTGVVEEASSYYSIFLGFREKEDFEKNVDDPNCGAYDLGSCGVAYPPDYCDSSYIMAKYICPGIPICAVMECELIPPTLKLKSRTKTEIEVRWDTFSTNSMVDENNFLGYHVELKTTSSSVWTNYTGNPVTSNSVELTNLSPYVSYDIQLRIDAKYMSVTDKYSEITIITEKDVPSIATDAVKKSTTPESITFTFDAIPQENWHDDSIKYVASISSSSSSDTNYFIPSVISAAYEMTISDLKPYTEYTIKMAGVNEIGAGDYGNEMVAYTDPAVPSSGPRPSEEDSTSDSITISFGCIPAYNWNSQTLQKFIVFYTETDYNEYSLEKEVVVTETCSDDYGVVLENLKPYRNHKIQVAAVNEVGTGTLGEELNVKTSPAVPTLGPEIETISDIDKHSLEITIAFLDPIHFNSDNLDPTSPYLAAWKETDTLHLYPDQSVIENKISVNGLESYTIYEFVIVANNDVGYGPCGGVVSHRTLQDIPFGFPQDVVGYVASHYSIGFNYTEVPLHLRKGIITNYVLECEEVGTGKIFNTMTTELHGDVIDLNFYTEYNCAVSACTSIGCGNYSAWETFLTEPTFPMKAPDMENASYINASSISAESNDISLEMWAKLEKRQMCLVVSKQDEVVDVSCIDYPKMTWVITGLDPYTEYNISSYCRNAYGDGPKDGEFVTVRTDELEPEDTPHNVEFPRVESNDVLLEWTNPVVHGIFRGVTISGTIVEEDKTAKRKRRSITHPLIYNGSLLLEIFIDIDSPNVTSAAIDHLFGNAMYSFIIAANNKYNGSFSEAFTVKTREGTPVISVMNFYCCAISHRSINLCWDHAPDRYMQGVRTQYTVYYREMTSSLSKNTTREPYFNSIQIYFLRPVTSYAFSLSASTYVGEGVLSSEIFCDTSEWYPNDFPKNVSAVSLMYPDAVEVAWSALPQENWLGNPYGYLVAYKRTQEGSNYLQDNWKHIRTDSLNVTYKLFGLDVCSQYLVKIAAYTYGGDGKYGQPVEFGTCRISLPEIIVNYRFHAPFVVPSTTNIPKGIMIESTEQALLTCAKSCSSFNTTVKLVYRVLNAVSDDEVFLLAADSNADEVFLPVADPSKTLIGGVFEMVASSPGFALLKAYVSPELILEENESSMIINILKSIQVFILYAALNCLFGVIFFLFEPMNGEERDQCYSLFAMCEGVYLAIMTSTTVGYGDKVPLTNRGKTYFVFWTLFGLVITGICVSNVSSTLSAFSIASFMEVYPSDQVIAVKGTREHKWGQNRFSISNATYENYEDVIVALENGDVQYALIDMFAMEPFRHRILEAGVEVKKTYPSSESQFGIVLTGKASLLKKCIKVAVLENQYILDKSVEQMRKQSPKQSTIDPPPSLETTVTLISFNAPMYRKALLILSISLIVFLLAGCFYDLRRRKKSKRIQSTATVLVLHKQSRLLDASREIKVELAAFLERFSELTDDMLYTHGEQLLTLIKSFSKLYGVNFKYVNVSDLGVSLETIRKYKEELKNQPKIPLYVRVKSNVMKRVAMVRIQIERVYQFFSA